jgi:hypothetical protein
MNEHKEIGFNIVPVIAFIRRHYQPWKDGPNAHLAVMLAWFWTHGFMAVSADESAIRAVCLIRIMNKLEDFLDPFAFDFDGDFIWIEILISSDPIAQADVHNQLEARWGPRRIVLWDRGERTQKGSPRIFTWAMFCKLKKRMTYGLI